MSQETNPAHVPRKQPRKLNFAKVFLLTYGIVLLLIFALPFIQPAKTEFSGRTGKDFRIAGIVVDPGPEEPQYRVLNLDYLRSDTADLDGLTFLLSSSPIVINVGDIHTVETIEDHGDSQIVEFHYSNTHTSTSTYRAYADRIEPISYRLTSSVGQVFLAGTVFVPILIASIVFVIIYNWTIKRKDKSNR